MSWIKSIFSRKRIEAELTHELQFHREEAIAVKMAGGLSRQEATRLVNIELGGSALILEESREVHRLAWFENVLLDVKYGARALRKDSGFTVLAILILALGIGANTAMFTVVNSILLRPLPFQDSNRLIGISSRDVGAQSTLVALRQQSSLADYAASTQNTEVNLTGQGEPARLVASEVSANFFDVLGAQPLAGRAFHDGEDQPGQGNVAILSYSLWKSRFNADPNAVGKSVTIDENIRQIVGVMPADFRYPSDDIELWIPIQIDPADVSHYLYYSDLTLIGRLRQGVSLPQARAEFKGILARVADQYRTALRNWGKDASVAFLQDVMVKDIRTYLLLLLGAVGMVLLIACANFANLLLVRSTSRQKELAIRSALGAARSRILQQVLIEGLMVSLAGGAAGLALASLGSGSLTAWLPAGTPSVAGSGLDIRVLVFTAAVSIATGFAFGLMPAISATRLGLPRSTQLTEKSAIGGRGKTLAGFVVLEIAISAIVLIGAGLLVRSVGELSATDPGFNPKGLLTMTLSPPQALAKSPVECEQYYRQIIGKVGALPGVADASAVSYVPLRGASRVAADIEGHPWTPGMPVNLVWDWTIEPGYLRTMRIPILSGRDFTNADAEPGEGVVLVSSAMAQEYWPGQDPIGKHIRGIWEKKWRRVIGVVGDVHRGGLGIDPSASQPQAYFPLANPIRPTSMMTLTIRTTGDPLDLIHAVREAVAGVNALVPVSHIQTMSEVLQNSISEPRSLMSLLAGFAALALLLGAVGTYGVISYSVNERRREIGIRMALGARPVAVSRGILFQSLVYAAMGLLLGMPTALALTRVLESQLFKVGTADPATYASAAATVAAVALFAAWLPAARASRLDPATTIREE